jgi:hypothetical protein
MKRRELEKKLKSMGWLFFSDMGAGMMFGQMGQEKYPYRVMAKSMNTWLITS